LILETIMPIYDVINIWHFHKQYIYNKQNYFIIIIIIYTTFYTTL